MRKLLGRPLTIALLGFVLGLVGLAVWLRGVLDGGQPPSITLADSKDFLLAGFAPDGRTLIGVSYRVSATGSHWAGPIRLWDPATGQVKQTLAEDWDHCHFPLRFSRDGRLFAMTGHDSVRLWDTDTGREHRFPFVKPSPAWLANSFDLAQDGRTLACGDVGAKTVRLWDTAEQRETVLAGASPPLGFDMDGARLATASDEGVKLWEVATGRELSTLPGKTSGMQSLAFSPDGKLLAAGVVNARGINEAWLWDTTGVRERAVLPVGYPVDWLSFSPDGAVLLAWNFGAAVPTVWDVRVDPPQPLPAPPAGPQWFVAPVGRTLVGRSWDDVLVWDLVVGQVRAAFPAPTVRGLDPVAVSPDGRLGYVHTSDWEGNSNLWGFRGGQKPSSNQDIVDKPFVLDLATGKVRAVLLGAWNGNFLPDGSHVAATAADGTIKVWDVPPPHSGAHWQLVMAVLGGTLAVGAGGWSALSRLLGNRSDAEG